MLSQQEEEKATEKLKHKYKRISHQENFIPFGIYSKDKVAEEKASNVFVGREFERANLIQKLLTSGRQAAFLVTGARGAGKTSFVDYCMKEYKRSYSLRFMRSNVGKLVSDYLVILISAFIALSIPVLIAQILIAQNKSGPFGTEFAILLSLILIWPIFLSLKTWRSYYLIKNIRRPDHLDEISIGEINVKVFFTVLITTVIFAIAALILNPVFAWLEDVLSSKNVEIFTKYLASNAFSLDDNHFALWLLAGAIFLMTCFFTTAQVHDVAIENKAISNEPKIALLFSIPLGMQIILLSLFIWVLNLADLYIPAAFGFNLLLCGAFSMILVSPHRVKAHPKLLVWLFRLMTFIGFLAPLSGICWGVYKEAGINPPDSLDVYKLVGAIVIYCVIVGILVRIFYPWILQQFVVKAPSYNKPRHLARFHHTRECGLVKVKAYFLNMFSFLLVYCVVKQIELSYFQSLELNTGLIITVLSLFILVFLAYLEYDWIIRPSRLMTQEASLDKYEMADGQNIYLKNKISKGETKLQRTLEEQRVIGRDSYRILAEQTIPHALLEFWLPVFSIKINLGFDVVDHKTIIGAMLTGIKKEYSKSFVSSASSRVMSYYLVFSFLFLWLVFNVSSIFFDLPDTVQKDGDKHSLAVDLLQETNLDVLLPLLYQDLWFLSAKSSSNSKHLLGSNRHKVKCDLKSAFQTDSIKNLTTPSEITRATVQRLKTASEKSSEESMYHCNFAIPKSDEGFYLYIYHLIIAFIMLLSFKRFFRNRPLLPFKNNLTKINALLNELSNTVEKKRKSEPWKFSNLFTPLVADNQKEYTHTSQPIDSRTIELKFVTLLNDLQQTQLKLSGMLFSLPNPEITFVFDELDKLVDKSGSVERENIPRFRDSVNVNASKRHILIQKLMSDMKNIISSAPAKFIFIGGRDLQDSWLADQTARTPLLTSIFDGVIYLPSLLLNGDALTNKRITDPLYTYFYLQHRRAKQLFDSWNNAYNSSSPINTVTLRKDMEYCPTKISIEKIKHRLFSCDEETKFGMYRITTHVDGKYLSVVDPRYYRHFLANFINFLAYRSQGNPKKLHELFGSLIHSESRVFSTKIHNTKTAEGHVDESLNCQNVLHFTDINIARIQFISNLFEQFQHYFHESLAGRDDKVVTSIFYLSDFLLKFHKRAFAWDSLEKIDEMADINRAPDIRTILQQMVNACAPQFFHQVLNGMYVFRFRSEMANEISYISRFSPIEMAAFNFTLDESTPLKELYINKLKDGGSGEPSLIASLGELYEYDEEFDSARKEYTRALENIDAQLLKQISSSNEAATTKNKSEDSKPRDHLSVVFDILKGDNYEICQYFSSWAVFRLRIMLQVGMTYEQSKNLERAQMQYSDADNFAQRIILSLTQPTRIWNEVKKKNSEHKDSKKDPNVLTMSSNNALHILKHFNLLFQPFFAKAWVAEKLEGSVDTSIDIVEKSIDFFRHILPFEYNKENISSTETSNSNLFLVMSELHNKTGDLCFFKGMSIDTNVNKVPDVDDQLHMGYLYQAHYHYAVSLHEIRAYVQYRISNAAKKFGADMDKVEKTNKLTTKSKFVLFGSTSYPSFVYTTLASNFSDISEATLARIDSNQLLLQGDGKDEIEYDSVAGLEREFKRMNKGLQTFIAMDSEINAKNELWDEWFGVTHPRESSDGKDINGSKVDVLNDDSPYGHSNPIMKKDPETGRLLTFKKFRHSNLQKFFAYLIFTDNAFHYLVHGGYVEDANNEYLKSIRTIGRFLLWHKLNPLSGVSIKMSKAEINKIAAEKKVSQLKVSAKAASLQLKLAMQQSNYSLKSASEVLVNAWASVESAWDKVAQAIAKANNLTKAVQVERDKAKLQQKKAAIEQKKAECVQRFLLEKAVIRLTYVLTRISMLSSRINRLHRSTDESNVLLSNQEVVIVRSIASTVMLTKGLIDKGSTLASKYKTLIKEAMKFLDSAVLINQFKSDNSYAQNIDTAHEILEELVMVYRYPILNRLETLNTLLCHKIIGANNARKTIKLAPDAEKDRFEEQLTQLHERAEELRDLQQKYDAPMHFPELLTGITFYSLGKLFHEYDKNGTAGQRKKSAYWLKQANHNFYFSHQSITMRRRYYENISNLYYLYDDFNDRQRHYNHAIQMFGSHLAAKYTDEIKVILKQQGSVGV
ncbi:MAG: ATP-binding protein [Algicola sp.]|nr:ATP-binding protein [Algicola sp.]